MVGVRVGLQRPHDRVVRLVCRLQDRLDRARVDLTGVVIVVQHGIDDGRLLGCGIGHQIADGVGGSSKNARMIGVPAMAVSLLCAVPCSSLDNILRILNKQYLK